MSAPILKVTDLRKSFAVKGGPLGAPARKLQAVAGINFEIMPGETLGLVGESGCGKSTTGRLIMRLIDPDQGEIRFQDQDISKLNQSKLRPIRRDLQMIFQDPFSSLNPRKKVFEILAEPFKLHRLVAKGDLGDAVTQLAQRVGLRPGQLSRYPHEFSGGQRQRIGIARALAVQPKLIIADEPVSALDLSIQAQVINLLRDIQREFGLTYLFIAHDLAVVEHISDRVAVMYLGRIVELASAVELYRAPRHPYSEALLNAVPDPDPGKERKPHHLSGEVPSPISPPSGCTFHPRCPYAQDICGTAEPTLVQQAPGHFAACHFSTEVGKFRTRR